MSFVGLVKTGSGAAIAYNPVGSTLYGICNIAANDPAKTVSIGIDRLINGLTIHVQFTNANTAANPTLTVDGIGPYPIYAYYTSPPGNVAAKSWAAGSVVSFTFDATVGAECWRMNDAGANAALITMLEGETASEATTRATKDALILSRVAPSYDSTATYRKNDLVVYSEQLYRCNDDITTAEAWTAAHWTATTVAAEREFKLVFTDVEAGVRSTATAEVSGTGVTGASVDRLVFEQIISTTGEYTFTYYGTDWMYDDSPVNIETYGITVEGTPVTDDEITVTYTAGTNPFVYNITHVAEGYPYRAVVPLANVISTMIPQVTYGLQDAVSGVFAPIVESYDGGIYLYATEEPADSITIPTIVLWG